MPRWIGVVFAAFSCIFLVAGWWCAIVQDHRLRHGQSVQATVTRLQMISHAARSGRSYEPQIRYRYNASGTSHESTDLFPANMNGPVEFALRDELFASLHEGSTVAA